MWPQYLQVPILTSSKNERALHVVLLVSRKAKTWICKVIMQRAISVSKYAKRCNIPLRLYAMSWARRKGQMGHWWLTKLTRPKCRKARNKRLFWGSAFLAKIWKDWCACRASPHISQKAISLRLPRRSLQGSKHWRLAWPAKLGILDQAKVSLLADRITGNMASWTKWAHSLRNVSLQAKIVDDHPSCIFERDSHKSRWLEMTWSFEAIGLKSLP